MCCTRKPSALIARMIFGDGAAPPVWMSTRWSNGTRASAGALTSMLRTVGAPTMLVTRCSAISRKISAGSTRRRQTCVPAMAVTDHGKHQPLAWKIGSVHRKTAAGGMGHDRIWPTVIVHVPR